jgi:threonine synthase
MAGIEPLSAELTAALGAPPDRVFCPVGGGGLLVAVWRGFRVPGGASPDGRAGPRIHAVQPALNDTLVGALRAGEAEARTVPPGPVTRVSGLGVPFDLDATAALGAVRASGGDGHLVSDAAVWEAQGALARHEGLFVEPAGAAAVAGLWQAVEEGRLGPDAAGERLVCLLTGHGLKDGVAAARLAPDALDPPVATADVGGALDRLLDRR